MSEPYTIKSYASRAEWLAARKLSIGASDAAAVCGRSRFSSPFALWCHKTDKLPETDNDSPMMVEAGRRHERTMALWFEDKTGLHTEGCGSLCHDVYYSIERPHMSCSLDAFVHHVDEWVPLELKCAWFDAAREWTSTVPLAYMIQVQHQLYVLGAPYGYIAVLLNGYDFRWYKVQRTEAFIQRLCERCDEFWQHVQTKTPPPTDWTTATTDALKAVHANGDGSEIELPDEFIEHANSFDEAAAALSQATKRRDKAANALRARMGAAEVARLPDGRVFRWRGSPRRFVRVK